MWGWGGCGNGMWSDELRNCVVVFESDFYVCVFEKVGDFSDISHCMSEKSPAFSKTQT